MRFSNQLLSLLAVTSVFSLKLENLHRRNETNTSFDPIYSVYNMKSEDVNKCFKNPTISVDIEKECNFQNILESESKSSALEKNCEPLSTDKCKNLIKEYSNELSACKAIPEDGKNYILSSFKNKVSSTGWLCQKNEKNEFCVFKSLDEGKNLDSITSFTEFAKESCKSKKCTEGAKDALPDIVKFKENHLEHLKKCNAMGQKFDVSGAKLEIETFTQVQEYMKSDECAQSGAMTTKASTFLIVTLALLLILF